MPRHLRHCDTCHLCLVGDQQHFVFFCQALQPAKDSLFPTYSLPFPSAVLLARRLGGCRSLHFTIAALDLRRSLRDRHFIILSFVHVSYHLISPWGEPDIMFSFFFCGHSLWLEWRSEPGGKTRWEGYKKMVRGSPRRGVRLENMETGQISKQEARSHPHLSCMRNS